VDILWWRGKSDGNGGREGEGGVICGMWSSSGLGGLVVMIGAVQLSYQV